MHGSISAGGTYSARPDPGRVATVQTLRRLRVNTLVPDPAGQAMRQPTDRGLPSARLLPSRLSPSRLLRVPTSPPSACGWPPLRCQTWNC